MTVDKKDKQKAYILAFVLLFIAALSAYSYFGTDTGSMVDLRIAVSSGFAGVFSIVMASTLKK